MSEESALQRLRLLQLTSATLPVGAYSYSEGLELLVETRQLQSAEALQAWMCQELRYGTLRVEAGIMLRAYHAVRHQEGAALLAWNQWWSAARDTEELRLQSWQMGRSLLRLFLELEDSRPAGRVDKTWPPFQTLYTQTCNYAIALGCVAAAWDLAPEAVLLGYLHSWATNLISAGIKLIPLGQTVGQQMLLNLQADITQATTRIEQCSDADLDACGWGLSLASMGHETLYSRLFRS